MASDFKKESSCICNQWAAPSATLLQMHLVGKRETKLCAYFLTCASLNNIWTIQISLGDDVSQFVLWHRSDDISSFWSVRSRKPFLYLHCLFHFFSALLSLCWSVSFPQILPSSFFSSTKIVGFWLLSLISCIPLVSTSTSSVVSTHLDVSHLTFF